jgi:hypothetical protein
MSGGKVKKLSGRGTSGPPRTTRRYGIRRTERGNTIYSQRPFIGLIDMPFEEEVFIANMSLIHAILVLGQGGR